MTWLALADHTQRRFSPCGIGIDQNAEPVVPMADGVQMQSGTLLVEAMLPDSNKPILLFGYEQSSLPAHRFLALRAVPEGGLSCLIGFGDTVEHVALDLPRNGPHTPLWISFSWNAATRKARLALEIPGTPLFSFRDVPMPLPLFATDLRDAFVSRIAFPSSATFAALSDTWEPLGPCPGLVPETMIDTPVGRKAVSDLRRGDLVLTEDNTQVPVLFTVQRRVPARGMARPVRLRAPYFGLRSDCTLSAMQAVLAQGSDVDYAHGCEAVLIPSDHLANGHTAQDAPCGPIIDYTQVVTPAHAALSVSHGAVDSLFVGRLRRNKEKTAASLLNALPRRDQPEHLSPCAPVLDHCATLFLEQQRFG